MDNITKYFTHKQQATDVIVYNRKSISIVQLTVPSDHRYKGHKYVLIMIDLQNVGYSVKYFAVARLTGNETNTWYKSFMGIKFTNRDFRQLKRTLGKIVITKSFVNLK